MMKYLSPLHLHAVICMCANMKIITYGVFYSKEHSDERDGWTPS